MKELARQYDFSPRLTGLMCSQPAAAAKSAQSVPEHKHFFSRHHRVPSSRKSHDLEKEAYVLSEDVDHDWDPLRDLNHYQVVDTIWHWSSVDLGPKYFCLGYNSLYHMRHRDQKVDTDLPAGTRIWTWLILCHDKTVISMVEDSYPHVLKVADRNSSDVTSLRRNMLNVFRQLSRTATLRTRNPIFLVPIRPHGDDGIDNAQNVSSDACGMLFYYLFDDWYSSYSLLAKQEHQYGERLSSMVWSQEQGCYRGIADLCTARNDVRTCRPRSRKQIESHR